MLYYGLAVGLILLASVLNVYQASQGLSRTGVGALFNVAGWILWLVASFNMKSSIEEHFSPWSPYQVP